MSKIDAGAYRQWYEFLRRSERYIACCDAGGAGPLAGLFADFGDVREGWDLWWPAHRYLFEEAEPDFIVEVIAPGQLSGDEGDLDQLTLLINLNQPARTITRHVAALVRQCKTRLLEAENVERGLGDKRTPFGAPMRDVSLSHRYSLNYKPRPSDIASLELTLQVFDFCSAEDSKESKIRKRRYRIAEELGICDPISSMNGKLDSAEINRATALVSRYYLQARNIIHNAEFGVFPDRGSPKEKSFTR